MKNSILENINNYEKKYKAIIVTYPNKTKRTFTPKEWAFHEDDVSKMNVKIKYYKKGEKTPEEKTRKWLFITIVLLVLISIANGIYYIIN